jgi:hypothetical protein
MRDIQVGDIIRPTYECRVGCISYIPLDAEGWCYKCQRDNEYEALERREKREAERAVMRFFIAYLERNL